MMATKWIQFDSFSDKFIDAVAISINETEFLAISKHSYTFHKYNAEKDASIELTHLDGIRFDKNKIAYDKTQQKLYFFDHCNQCIYAKKLQDDGNDIVTYQTEVCGEYFLFVNNYFHIFDNHNKHWIGAIQNEKLKCTHHSINEIRYSSYGQAIYVPSKQLIVLIGGYNDDSLIKDIWIYSLLSQKWKKVQNISFEKHWFGAVLTSNEQYIVLLGGHDDDEQFDNEVSGIYVLDMSDENNWKIKQSKLLCPNTGQCCAVRTGGDSIYYSVLVNGYIRDCFKKKEFAHLQLPPAYIMAIIKKWYSAEMIHWLKDNKHFGIYLKDILSSL